RGEEDALPPPVRGGGNGAVPAQAVPRPEAVLARRARRDDPDARRDDRACRRSGRARCRPGMAHRGRLNVLAHTIGTPYEYILREFEGERTIDAVAADPEGGTGDVKYHLTAAGT